MKPKFAAKILLDIILIILFVALYLPSATGLIFHELAGLGIIVFVTVHLALNGQWVFNVLKKVRKPKNAGEDRKIILNAVLFLGFMIIFVSGILISKEVFLWQDRQNFNLFSKVHSSAAYLWISHLLLHVLLHVRYLFAMTTRIARKFYTRNVRRVFAGFAVTVSLLVFLYMQTASLLEKRASAQTSAYAKSKTEITDNRSEIRGEGKKSNSGIDSQLTTPDQSANGEEPTLSEFLGNMFCTACNRHCSLFALQCLKGETQVEKAKLQYEQLFGDV